MPSPIRRPSAGRLLLLGERGVVRYPGEVFPTEVRGIGTGFAAAVSRVGAGLGTFLLPIVVERFGVSATVSGVSRPTAAKGGLFEHGSRSGSSQHHRGGAAWGRSARAGRVAHAEGQQGTGTCG